MLSGIKIEECGKGSKNENEYSFEEEKIIIRYSTCSYKSST